MKKFGNIFAAALIALASLTIGFGEPNRAHAQDEPLINELADGVYQWMLGNYGSLVVISGNDVMVTDPSQDQRAAAMKEFVASLTNNPVNYVVLSHEHYDHVGGTGVFENAKVICHVNCQPLFDLDVLGMAPKKVDETFTEMKSFKVGEIDVELHFIAPGDGDATTVVYLPEQKIIFTADLYEDRMITHKNFVDDKNFTGTRKILNTLSEWDLNHAVNAHSVSTDPQVLRDNAEYYNDLFDVVLAIFQKALADEGYMAFYTLPDRLPAMVSLPKYKDWQNYDGSLGRHAVRMFASIAHAD